MTTTLAHYLTRKEAAEYLRVSLRTIDNLIARRSLSCIRLGGRTLLRRSALEQALARLEIPAVA